MINKIILIKFKRINLNFLINKIQTIIINLKKVEINYLIVLNSKTIIKARVIWQIFIIYNNLHKQLYHSLKFVKTI